MVARLPNKQFRIRHVKTGNIYSDTWSNCRDLVRHSGYEWTKGEAVAIAEAKVEAESKSFIKGNDPTTIDVDKLVASYAADIKTTVLDDMTRDELAVYAEANGVTIDKRHSREKQIADIKAAAEAAVAEPGAPEGE